MTTRRLPHLLRPRSFGRYFVVGVINTLIGVASFPLLYTLLGDRFGINPLLIFSWIACTGFAFLLHKHVTFRSSGTAHRESVKFFVLSFTILAINLVVLNLTMALTTANPVAVQIATSLTLAIVLMILNYLGLDRLVFPPETDVK